MIEIEFEPPTLSHCECCGADTVTLVRFVLKDSHAHAVYYAQYSRGHESDVISGIVSLGPWGDSALETERLAFPFKMWASDDNYHVALVDASESPWGDETYLGNVLDREEALAHPWRSEVFHLTDHMVSDDPQIGAFLNGSSDDAA